MALIGPETKIEQGRCLMCRVLERGAGGLCYAAAVVHRLFNLLASVGFEVRFTPFISANTKLLTCSAHETQRALTRGILADFFGVWL